VVEMEESGTLLIIHSYGICSRPRLIGQAAGHDVTRGDFLCNLVPSHAPTGGMGTAGTRACVSGWGDPTTSITRSANVLPAATRSSVNFMTRVSPVSGKRFTRCVWLRNVRTWVRQQRTRAGEG
jgi:hypothetical protein